MRHTIRNRPLAILAASTTLFALPATAADIAASGAPVAPVEIGTTDAYQGWGWGGGWGGGYGRRHRDRGVDVGDVLAGVLVIGAIAAIADSASNSSDERRRREREDREYRDQQQYRNSDDRRTQSSNFQSSRGIDSAVEMCIDQVERGSDRVESVDNAARTADGWRVSGSLADGNGWNCWIDNDGRVRQVDLASAPGGQVYAANTSAGGSQLSDETYARARAGQRDGATAAAVPASASDPRPAYPGGPLPGEEGYTESVQLSAR